jgi:hypothetical protein
MTEKIPLAFPDEGIEDATNAEADPLIELDRIVICLCHR